MRRKRVNFSNYIYMRTIELQEIKVPQILSVTQRIGCVFYKIIKVNYLGKYLLYDTVQVQLSK